eukprot:15570073-Heterocapsa_arctica.AAC.1
MSADSSGSVWVRGRSLIPAQAFRARAALLRGRPLGRSQPRATQCRRSNAGRSASLISSGPWRSASRPTWAGQP